MNQHNALSSNDTTGTNNAAYSADSTNNSGVGIAPPIPVLPYDSYDEESLKKIESNCPNLIERVIVWNPSTSNHGNKPLDQKTLATLLNLNAGLGAGGGGGAGTSSSSPQATVQMIGMLAQLITSYMVKV